MKRDRKILIMVILIVLGVVIFDQLSKAYAREHIKGNGVVKVVGSFVVLKYAENSGAFLGLGSDISQPYKIFLLVFFPIAVILGAIIYLVKGRNLSVFQVICLSSIIGGGISNILDRVFNNGYVTDFLNFGIGRLRTGILNFADMFITFGAILLLVSVYLGEKNNEEKEINR